MMAYSGRFAPSPTGQLHMGSLLAAVASYADARHHNGNWFLRIDNIDTPRVVADAEKAIVSSLECLGFEWDGSIQYQDNYAQYNSAIDKLKHQGLIYPCTCSRKQIKLINANGIYPATCRDKKIKTDDKPFSLRLNTRDLNTRDLNIRNLNTFDLNSTIIDRVQPNSITDKLAIEEDFILVRSDKIISYHLASVIDDHRLGVNQIIRGYDLIDSSLKQALLYQLLHYPIPHYLHIPILVNNKGIKLSKSSQAKAINNTVSSLYQSAILLGQAVDKESLYASTSEFWSHLIDIWDISLIPKYAKLDLNKPVRA